MLKSHMNAIEAVLLAQSSAASNAGHPNLRGGPREWFIRDFLSGHLPGTLEIGQGEIIDPFSQPHPGKHEYRPQVDIVLYRKDLPRISYSEYDQAFLAEGVMATIEVKSLLTHTEFEKACRAGVTHKQLARRIPGAAMGGGWQPEHIVVYLVAFAGPVKMETVAGWLPEMRKKLNCAQDLLPEMIVVLGKGTIWFIDHFPDLVVKGNTKQRPWACAKQTDQNIFTLFVHMLSWMGWATPPPDTTGYVESLSHRDISFY